MMTFNEEQIEKAIKVVSNFKKPKTKKDVFYNFCFCILVPQCRFKTVFQVVDTLKRHDFYKSLLSKLDVLELIKEVRFKNIKANHLIAFKENYSTFYPEFKAILDSDCDPRIKRNFVVSRTKGLGLKASSHLLRNLGEERLAIVDTHVLKYLEITSKKFDYIKVEDTLREQSKQFGVSIAVLDAMIWSSYSKVDDNKFIY